jgi:hypothetical protein
VIRLLVAEESEDSTESFETRFGGRPSVPTTGFAWPSCRYCRSNMQFLGQLRLADPDRLILLFMCQNDPGLCGEWEADGGANAASVVLSHDVAPAVAPAEGNALRETQYGAKTVNFESPEYESARAEWSQSSGRRQRDVLGQLGGEPSWLQADETPSCNACGEQMAFVAQLEPGPDADTEMNFGGGGCAYVFECGCSGRSAKMLWQC